ncbi:uncharacterized protein LOC144358045 [Saccoglossus kowalevskii]
MSSRRKSRTPRKASNHIRFNPTQTSSKSRRKASVPVKRLVHVPFNRPKKSQPKPHDYIDLLEKIFMEHKHPSNAVYDTLSRMTQLKRRSLQSWFYRRRVKHRKLQKLS